MAKHSLPTISGKVYELIEPLDSMDRHKVVAGVLALLGETPLNPGNGSPTGGSKIGTGSSGLTTGPNASRWIEQNKLSREMLEQVFHFGDNDVQIIASSIPGSTKKEKTVNSYLLMGAQSLLAFDDSSFTESDAIAFCKHHQCYDRNNHTTNRKEVGNRTVGNRKEGFKLAAPGLTAAAEVVRQAAGARV